MKEEEEREELERDEEEDDDDRSQTARKFVHAAEGGDPSKANPSQDFDGAASEPSSQDINDAASQPSSQDFNDAMSERSSIISSYAGRLLDENVRGMIFVRTLDLSKALLDWMKRHPVLRQLNPGRITGVNAGVKNGGRELVMVVLFIIIVIVIIFVIIIIDNHQQQDYDHQPQLC